MKFLLLFLLVICFQLNAQNIIQKDFKSSFDAYGVKGCFALYDPVESVTYQYNPERCDSGFLPASTFKIPHSVIALEEGVISDTNELIPWNGYEWPTEVWNQDQTMSTAIKYSCIWAYFTIAEQIPIEKYQEYMEAFDYGNKDLSGPPTRFWLGGPFRISVNQQLLFLQKFYTYALPVSRESIDRVKPLIIFEQNDDYMWSGKTGSGRITDTKFIFWLVGYLEKEGRPYYYALNFTGWDLEKLGHARYEIARSIFRELELMP
ncbi:MAG: class D beta-lactamase [Bacteroidales bacterium]|nr:class D beta-lactamase [Bacteroidales bacterium]